MSRPAGDTVKLYAIYERPTNSRQGYVVWAMSKILDKSSGLIRPRRLPWLDGR